MDRLIFNKLIIDDLLLIINDEIEHLHRDDNNRNWIIESPLQIKEEKILLDLKKGLKDEKEANECYKEISSQIEHGLKELYYLYDYHKLGCKDALGNHAIDLDRHKLSVIFLCMIISYRPIRFIRRPRCEYPSQDLVLANYRVAFRFACSYASRALFNSFIVRKEEYETKYKNSGENNDNLNRKISMYSEAMSKLEKQGRLSYPATREGLEKYFENFIKVLYLQFDDIGEDDSIPYALLADTFYWLDVYTKLKLGVEVREEEYPNGLRRN